MGTIVDRLCFCVTKIEKLHFIETIIIVRHKKEKNHIDLKHNVRFDAPWLQQSKNVIADSNRGKKKTTKT